MRVLRNNLWEDSKKFLIIVSFSLKKISLIKSLKNRKTVYLGTKTFRRANSGGFGYAGNQY